MVRNLAAMQDTQVRSLGWEDPLEKRMATHSSILAWRIPWTEETGGLQSMGSQRVRHDWVTKHSTEHDYMCKSMEGKRGDICIRIADSLSCTVETKKTLQSNYFLMAVPAMQEIQVQWLGCEDPLEKATYSRILAWRIPMDRGACWATVHGVTKSHTWLSN